MNMNQMIDMTVIMKGIILILVGVADIFLIPWLKGKFTETELANLKTVVKVAVEAAEQIFPEEKQGELKKQYVVDFLASKKIKYDEEEIDALIESSVLELNNKLQ